MLEFSVLHGLSEIQHQSRTESAFHAVDATHRSFHTDTKGFATRFMANFKADIESRAKASTVRFSLVSFSTDVSDKIDLGDDLASTIAQTNDIVYTGGWTNTEQAIAQCDETLSSVGFGSSLRYILLFTDGTPTTWGAGAKKRNCTSVGGVGECFTAASAAADAAKGNGIEVITVAVNTGDLDVPFLFSLNSTGLGFQVTSFDEAEDVTLKILGEIDISCPPLS